MSVRFLRVLPPGSSSDPAALAAQLSRSRTLVDGRLAAVDAIAAGARRQGFAIGAAEAWSRFAQLRHDLQSLLDSRPEQLRELVLGAVHGMLGALPPELVAARLAERALQSVVDDAGTIRVQVAVSAGEAVRAELVARGVADAAGLRVSVLEDDRVPEASCRVETRFAVLEADLGSQVDALARAFPRQP